MHYLVTGGAGFIGSHLCHALLSCDHSVTIVDDLSTGKRANIPPRARFIKGDICDKKLMEALFEDIDGCFHLAAIASVARSNEEWLYTHQVNLSATIGLFEAAKSHKTPVVYASSAAVYGEGHVPAFHEQLPPRPLSAYGADKLGCELHGRVAAHVHGVPNAAMRFFNVYGPRQDPSSPYSGVISIFAKRILSGQPFTVFGDGEQSRDFIYVLDVVDALQRAMVALEEKCFSHDVFNVCTGLPTTINAMAKMIGEITHREYRCAYGDARTGDLRYSLGDPTHAYEKIGFKAQVPLNDGMEITLDCIAEEAPALADAA